MEFPDTFPGETKTPTKPTATGAVDLEHVLSGLTRPQREAASHVDGPLLVLAGPGSGKTRVITRRIAHLIGCGIPAWQILALTFTNKAAQEMRDRADVLLGEGSSSRGLTVTTFHSLGARLLRKHAESSGAVGLKGDFSIYDAADQTSLVKRVIADLDLATTNWPPRSVLSAISDAKNRMVTADQYAAQATDFHGRTVARIFQSYEASLRAAGAMDFDDLLVLTARMLADSESVLAQVRDRWKYLMIDEYQDTNHAQFTLARLLAGEGEADAGPNLCVVGDPDQSIYGWRGADMRNILEFESAYPKATVVTLGENFRSRAPIISAADALIKHNRERRPKDLHTSREGGAPVECVLCRDEHHEAQLALDWLRARAEPSENGAPGLAWKDMAVFYRTNALSRVMEETLRDAGVPYTIARGAAFYEREEIKNALSYLRVAANPADDVSLARIVNTPTRGIGATSLGRMTAAAKHAQVPVLSAMSDADRIEGVSARAANSAKQFVEMLAAWTGAGTFMGQQTPGSLAQLVERVIDESGLRAMYRAKGETEAERLDNLDELISSAAQFQEDFDVAGDPAADIGESGPAGGTPPLLATLRAYLERVSLVADADRVDPERGSVTLMTLHAAKGLEFPAVVMIGLEEGTLPHGRANESDEQLEEERRLCFVGITRAMDRLLMTASRYRTVRGARERCIPSRFLSEIPQDEVSFSDQSDPAGFDGDDLDDDGFERPRSGSRRGPIRARTKLGVALETGALVRHPRFGMGKVVAVTPGANARATVRFAEAGVKTLVLEHAPLDVVG